MKKLFYILALLVFCGITHAALIPNPDSFEYCGDICLFPPCPPWDVWESWGSGSGSAGWQGSNGWAEVITGDGTHGSCCLQTTVPASLDIWGYVLAFTHGNPIVPGQIYEYFFDYKSLGGDGVFKLEFWEDPGHTIPVGVTAWDPYPVPTPNVWHHFSYTFRAPENAEFVTLVVGATGVGSTMRFDTVGLRAEGCYYELEGDINNDCRVTLADFVLLASNWLVDCIDDPANPACVTP